MADSRETVIKIRNESHNNYLNLINTRHWAKQAETDEPYLGSYLKGFKELRVLTYRTMQ